MERSGDGALFPAPARKREERVLPSKGVSRLATPPPPPAFVVSWATWPSLIGRDNIGRFGRRRQKALGGCRGRVDFPLFLPPSAAQQQKEIDKRRRKSQERSRTGHGLKFSARAGPGFLTLSPGRAGLSPRAGPAGRARGLKTGP